MASEPVLSSSTADLADSSLPLPSLSASSGSPSSERHSKKSTTADGTSTAHTLPQGFDRRAIGRIRPLSLLSAPAPLRRFFALFPLRTLPAETRPAASLPPPTWPSGETSIQLSLWLRLQQHGKKKSVGGGDEDVHTPSYDLDSLVYQTFLLARGISFRARDACEEASPDGRLPFLIATTREPPAANKMGEQEGRSGSKKQRTSVIRTAEIPTFVRLREQKRRERQAGGDSGKDTDGSSDEEERREALGMSLVETQLRPAFLWALYMTPANFSSIVLPLYIDPAVSSSSSSSKTSNASSPSMWSLASHTLARGYRASALRELAASFGTATLAAARQSPEARRRLGDELFRRAGEALDRLERLHGGRSFFTDGDAPGLLDATVFAYAYLLTGHSDAGGQRSQLQWKDARLGAELDKREWLARHRDEVWTRCFGPGSMKALWSSTSQPLYF